MTTVVVYPLSGYVNRLQALVSAQLLAADLDDALLRVCWLPDPAAPAEATDVLDAARWSDRLVSDDDVRAMCGIDRASIPTYLSVDQEAKRITLAGYDLGEQHFIPALRAAVDAMPDVRHIVIAAGGKYTLDGDSELTAEQTRRFRTRRQQAYAALALNPLVEAAAREAISAHAPYVALHLRYSDRNMQAPRARAISPAVEAVADATGVRRVFIASDTTDSRARWTQRVRAVGLDPWSVDPGEYPRSDPRSALGALIDWRILGGSAAMVYFAASSFAEEAAVASGHVDDSIGLETNKGRAALLAAAQWAKAAATYPQRHWVKR